MKTKSDILIKVLSLGIGLAVGFMEEVPGKGDIFLRNRGFFTENYCI